MGGFAVLLCMVAACGGGDEPIYLAVFSNLSNQEVNIDGEIYTALESDRPCE